MTEAARHTKSDAVVINESDLLRKLMGFVAYSSVNGHAQTPVLVLADRLPSHLVPSRSLKQLR